jgi:hypothetical protein
VTQCSEPDREYNESAVPLLYIFLHERNRCHFVRYPKSKDRKLRESALNEVDHSAMSAFLLTFDHREMKGSTEIFKFVV